MSRYYYPHPLKAENIITLEGNEHHHLFSAMRGKPNDTVEIVNGSGALATARIDTIDKRSASLTMLTVEEEQREKRTLILAQAIPRITYLDTIVEKATELGASALWLFPGEKGARSSLTEHQLERLKAITIAALKQCGRLFLPKIVSMPPLVEWKNLPYPLLFGTLEPEALPLSQTATKDAILCIGPESGFSPQELSWLQQHGKAVSLGKYTLRADTASIAALAIMQSKCYG